MVYKGKFHWNGWFRGTPIYGNHHIDMNNSTPCGQKMAKKTVHGRPAMQGAMQTLRPVILALAIGTVSWTNLGMGWWWDVGMIVECLWDDDGIWRVLEILGFWMSTPWFSCSQNNNGNNHHGFSWVNQRFLWSCSRANCWIYQRVWKTEWLLSGFLEYDQICFRVWGFNMHKMICIEDIFQAKNLSSSCNYSCALEIVHCQFSYITIVYMWDTNKGSFSWKNCYFKESTNQLVCPTGRAP